MEVVPVVTKVDMPHAQPEDIAISMALTFDLDPDDVLPTSAKSGLGVDRLLPAIIKRVPPPTGLKYPATCRARVVDSWFDDHRGVVCLVQVVDGALRESDKFTTWLLKEGYGNSGIDSTAFTVQEIGLLTGGRGSLLRTGALFAGQVGY